MTPQITTRERALFSAWLTIWALAAFGIAIAIRGCHQPWKGFTKQRNDIETTQTTGHTGFDVAPKAQADQCRQRSICRDQASKTYKPTITATLPPSRRKPSIGKSQTVADWCNYSLVVEAPCCQASRNVTAKDSWERPASRRELEIGYALRARFALVGATDPGSIPGWSTPGILTDAAVREEQARRSKSWLHPWRRSPPRVRLARATEARGVWLTKGRA